MEFDTEDQVFWVHRLYGILNDRLDQTINEVLIRGLNRQFF